MKKFLILQLRPEDETTKSELESFLRFGGLAAHEVKQIRLDKNPNPDIDIHDYSAILVGGSPFDVTIPEEEKSELQKRIEQFFMNLLHRVVSEDFPFLGVCAGNGLLGKYSGVSISNTYAEPLGNVEITITETGTKDPLLKGLPRTFSAFVGHKEACNNIPSGAELLVTSEACPVQMFRIKENIYSTQFHLEADADEFILRIKVYKYNGYFPPSQAQELIEAIKDKEAPVPHEILRRFVNRYKVRN